MTKPDRGNNHDAPVSQQPQTAEERQAGTKARSEWLQNWAREHARASVHEAREAVKAQFKMTLGTTLISQIMKEARDQAGLPPARRGRTDPGARLSGVVAGLSGIVAELRAMGVVSLEITDDDFKAQMIVTGKKT